MVYELEMESYRGPLEKLLELVEEKKLEVTAVNLAEVTADFLAYLNKLEEEKRDRGLIADFLAVASKLVLIKSKVLLPSLPLSEEEEGDIKNLEARLRLYRELKRTQAHIKAGWHEVPAMREREFLMSASAIFYPPKGVDANALRASVGKIFGEFEKLLRPVETVKREIVNLKTKIGEVLARITEHAASFKALRNGASRSEVVVLFLAILHLIKEQLVDAEQDGGFGDILIAKNGGRP